MPEQHERSSPSDLLSLDMATQSPRDAGAGASSQDSIINAAEMFQAQLDQMTTWKHQLAQQMEVMRRDGIKLLERQKNLAIEKKRANEEREALAGERNRIGQLQQELEAETRRLTERAAELEAAHAQLQTLRADKERWERELSVARTEVESLAARKSVTASELAAAEGRLAEITALEQRRDQLQREIAESEQRLVNCAAERKALDAADHEIVLRQAEMAAGQKALAEREARCLAEDVRLKEAMEQVEALRRQLAEAQRKTSQDGEAVAAQREQIAAAQQAVAQQKSELAARESAVRAEKLQLEEAHHGLASKQAELSTRDAALAEKTKQLETELQSRLARAEQLRQQAADERQAVQEQRAELQKRLDSLDGELAEQLESLAKQTKRLTERRSTVEAAERDLDRALEQRIAAATNAMRGELSDARATYEQKIAGLERQIAQSQSSAEGVHAREAALQQELSQKNAELTKLQEELLKVSTVLEDLKDKNVGLVRDLSAQVDRAKADARKWQETLDSARAQTSGSDETLQQARRDAAAARAELEAANGKLAALKTAQEEMQFQLELQAEETQKQLRAMQAEMAGQLAARDGEIAEWKAKYQAAAATSANDGDASSANVAALQQQIETLESQRSDLAQHLFTIQDELRRHQEDALLAQNGMEGKLLALQQANDTLEAEKSAWQAVPHHPPTLTRQPLADLSGDAAGQIAEHRQRLLQKARTLRAFRLQIADYQAGLEKNREEIAQQREQLRVRKENLEQVKRLLEKQEMVMARKLADHNAIKTVAAVGIFVIMILGGAFLGVFKFVRPLYRSEAVVQLAPAAELQGPELAAWLKQQEDFIRSPDVTSTAWKILRSGDEHYGMHDVREEWLGSLPEHLVTQLEAGTKTLSIRYTGPDAEGVSQVCNALAAAYTTPTMRDPNEATRNVGLGAQTVAKATVPLSPAKDNRMVVSLIVVAGVLFISLILVMLFRHFVARQLREIDQMADAQDLDDMRSDMNGEAGATPAT